MNVKHFVQATVHNVRQFFKSMIAPQHENPPIIPSEPSEAQPPFSTTPVDSTVVIETSKPLADQSDPASVLPSEGEPYEADAPLEIDDNDLPEQAMVPSLSIENLATTLPVQAVPLLDQPLAASPESIYLEICGEKLQLTTVLESLLFVADTPVEPASLARLLHFDITTIEASLQLLAQTYQDEGRGLRLQERNGKFQLVTMPAAAALIEDFLNLEATTKLSGPALETLAVIAYRQPITRMQIEAVRGVDSAGVLRSLVQRGLAEEIGRLDVAGRPILYGVTDLFMQHFGLTKLGELPPLESSEADTLWATTQLAELNGRAN